MTRTIKAHNGSISKIYCAKTLAEPFPERGTNLRTRGRHTGSACVVAQHILGTGIILGSGGDEASFGSLALPSHFP